MYSNLLVSNFLFPLAACAILHVASSLSVRTGLFPKNTHRTVWNVLLLAAFALCATTGALLSFRMFLPDLQLAIRLHDQSGAILLAAGLGHVLERFAYFLAKGKAAWIAAGKTVRQWPGVIAAIAALVLLLALPSTLAEIVAQRQSVPQLGPARSPSIEPAATVASKADRDTATGAARAVAGGPSAASRKAVGRTDPQSPPAKILEADRILSIGDVTANPKRVPVRIDNRSKVETVDIEALLRQVKDPEVSLNIYDLGLIRTIDVDSAGNLSVGMVLTTPTCPNNAWLVGRLRGRLSESGLFRSTAVAVLANIPWSQNFITAEGSRTIVELGKW
jgi:metal-sulfur cluster biosynthetic enzyme